jgi:hypothetical protein
MKKGLEDDGKQEKQIEKELHQFQEHSVDPFGRK